MPDKHFTRRGFLRISTLSAAVYPFLRGPAFCEEPRASHMGKYPVTERVLCEGYRSELTACKRYRKYCRKALSDGYPNIAYTFFALAVSEKTHAENYSEILTALGLSTPAVNPHISVSGTKINLKDAAKRELEKIHKLYPAYLGKLSVESHDRAVVSCMYALKSHRQHEKEIHLIARYIGLFFGAVSDEIEQTNLDFHVCTICGSTLYEAPESPCEICNRPFHYYRQIPRPVL